MIEVDSMAFGVRMPGFDLVLLLIGCVTLDKSFHFSELQFSTSKMRNITAPTSLSF